MSVGDLLSQLRLLGFLPLVLEEAGSRVAVTRAGAARAARTVVKCILNNILDRNDWRSVNTGKLGLYRVGEPV